MKPLPKPTMRQALSDPALLGSALPGDSWKPWRTLLIASRGEPLLEDELPLFTALTGRAESPAKPVSELAAIVGRRGGKSRALSVLATYLAAFTRPRLSPGETGVVLMLAPDERQAAIDLEYCKAVLDQSPLLSKLVKKSNTSEIILRNRASLQTRAASFRRLRGMTLIAAILDESAFFFTDEHNANADVEIANALRPALLTTGGPLIMASSPYAKRGILWDAYRRDYGPEGDPAVLVCRGGSTTFNSSLSQAVIDRALEKDYASAAAEYLAEFRSDIEGFVSQEIVRDCLGDYVENPPSERLRYSAFVDPSGGSSDSFTLAISHITDGITYIDAIREIKPPFSPESAVVDLVSLLRRFSVREVRGDRYAGLWPREQFGKRGITYLVSEKPKSDLYRDFLPLLNSGTVVLPKSEKLVTQLCGLERRTSRIGKDTIDHGPGQHDDIANAVAGAAYFISERFETPTAVFGFTYQFVR